ncbi:histidine phosphatase family protein [Psychromonas sp. KJ10-10]|uniref:histidine phosphatase family protein n=1 Tax=Psychromonas sp. KJ10-10 TaxID=3391823 RepID=UPI0039B4D39B
MHGNVESFKQARHRSNLMVNELLSLVENNKKIVIFGHGLMNRFIYYRLIKLGWTNVKRANRNHYWSFQVIHK